MFKDKVAARVDDLDNLGKFVTLFQYVLILVVIRSRFIEDFQGNDDCLLRVEAFVFEIFGIEK